ncbi:hypothetical protein WJ978_20110 [Achromobacter xylosoxidans]
MARVENEAAFRQLARVYNAGTPLEIPHVLFVIDRQRGNRIHYLDTPRYGLHETFARAAPAARQGQGRADRAVQGPQPPPAVRHPQLAA